LGLAAALAAGLSLVAHAYMGSFSRYLADDFCTASSLRRLGFLGSQSYWYDTWTGRYAYTFVISLAQAAGPRLTPWMPALVLVAWVGLLAFAIWRLLGARAALAVGLGVAAVHAYAVLRGSPSVYQSLYWETGLVTYTLPLVAAIAFGVWLWRTANGQAGPHRLPIAGGLALLGAFALGGFSETYVVLQTAALVLLLVSLPWSVEAVTRRRAGWVGGLALAGSLLAAVVIVSAPGTGVRRALMPPPPALFTWIAATLKDARLFMARTVRGSPDAIFFAIAVPCLLVLAARLSEAPPRASLPRARLRGPLLLLALALFTPLLLLATIAPYEFAVSSYPDARVLITTMFALVSGLVLWGAVLGDWLSDRDWMRSPSVRRAILGLAAIFIVGLLAASLRSTAAILEPVATARNYARSWETRDRNLRQVDPGTPAPIPAASLHHMGGLAEIGRDPAEWINRCVAGTYGLESVVAK